MTRVFRTDLQKIAELRVKEARKLLNQKMYPGAYYLAGLGIECALKACIAKTIDQHEFPDKKRAQDCFTHDLADLLKHAHLTDERLEEGKINPTFDVNWKTVSLWTVESRYRITTTRKDALGIYSAIISRKYGVLTWIRGHW